MTDFTNLIEEEDTVTQIPARSCTRVYAVYDYCVTNHVPSRDLAFIEERWYDEKLNVIGDEKHFLSLKDAKLYAKTHFQSGGEYFSLNQSAHPDNFLYIMLDKIRYLLA
jgi:hypothetical protein